MSGITDTQSLRFGQVTDPISHTILANLADDIATQLDAADVGNVHALTRPVVQVARMATFTLAVNTVTTITFDSLANDTHGMVNLGTQPQRVTVSAAAGTGIYHVQVNVTVDTPSWTKGDVILQKNGAFYAQKTEWQPFLNGGPNAEWILPIQSVGDYLTVALYHEGGGTTTGFEVDFQLHKISD